jgi:hypothetical protein
MKNVLKKKYSNENILKEKYPLKGFFDTHLHTAPDVKPRILSDVEAASLARKERMRAIILKSHLEPTAGRAMIAKELSGVEVIGGICLNQSVGGLNPEAVKATAALGGRIVWLPTISYSHIDINNEFMEDILQIIAQKDLVLGTGHLSVEDIFTVLDSAKSLGIRKLMVNHPLTRVVGATIDQQKDMSRYAYLEHCFVACMEKHDKLDPALMGESIKYVGPERCIMATDFGQAHNPPPVEGMKMFIKAMLENGISWKDIVTMCSENPGKLFPAV